MIFVKKHKKIILVQYTVDKYRANVTQDTMAT